MGNGLGPRVTHNVGRCYRKQPTVTSKEKKNIVSKNLRGQMVLSGQWVATAAVNMANI